VWIIEYTKFISLVVTNKIVPSPLFENHIMHIVVIIPITVFMGYELNGFCGLSIIAIMTLYEIASAFLAASL
jgi:hypothetical protein